MGYLEFFLCYLFLINAAGFLLMLIDKKKAINRKRRIPEKTLMTVAVIGGSLGSLIGMYTFHHKTRKNKFKLGIPAALFVQVCLIIYLIYAVL